MLNQILRTLCFATLLTMTLSAQTTPSPSLERSGPVYELRIYHAYPGKLEDLHKRFREHTLEIFARHGLKVVDFWGPIENTPGFENTLIYVLEFPSREASKSAWKEFQADPEWQRVRNASEANGKLVEKVDSIFMRPTDYAPKH